MVRRPSSARAWIVLTLLVSGCQDYNFNPVGHCLLQPGSERVTLSNLATADILFVVDDSGSMRGEQDGLAANFDAFVNNLTTVNTERASNGLDPLDFHIAITSTSVFQATYNQTTCRNDCAGGNGAQYCCAAGAAPYRQPVYCADTPECGSGFSCRTDCPGFAGDRVCCGTDNFPKQLAPETCETLGAYCGTVRDHYRGQFVTPDSVQLCDAGVGTPGAPYPAGDFVAAAGNPRVISFEKALYNDPAGTNTAGIAQRIQQFRQNIVVGTCGSGQEQALEAARLAMKKALGQDGLSQPAGVSGWPHEDAKLVVVFVGDEDDCSSPKADPVVLLTPPTMESTFPADEDECTTDTSRRFARQEYLDFFKGLGRPFSAAFIESMSVASCSTGDCAPAVCCDEALGNACNFSETPGYRFTSLADDLRGANVEVVEGSVCADFGTTLGQIAELVKPPTGLELPTQPAATEVTVLRIAAEGGLTRKTCVGPAPAGTSGTALAGYDWWFTATAQSTAPSDLSRFVFINHDTGNCEANPGETYSADYLGVVPQGGVSGAGYTQEAGSPECEAALGGDALDWTWYPVPGLLRAGTGEQLGTCVCG
jgi:hypothetical protein